MEQGTHNDLLAIPDGAYARLVHAQKLRESTERDATKAAGDGEDAKDIEKEAQEEIPLGRRNTSRSLASEILASKGEKQEGESDIGMIALMVRLAKENRDSWKMYGFGSIAAVGTGLVYPAFGVVYCEFILTYLFRYGIINV